MKDTKSVLGGEFIDLLKEKGENPFQDFEKLNGLTKDNTYLFAIEKDRDGTKGVEFMGSTNSAMMIALLDYIFNTHPEECRIYMMMRVRSMVEKAIVEEAMGTPENKEPI